MEEVAPFVGDSGICPTSDTGRAQIIRDLNIGCYNLHKRLDSEGTLFEWYVPVNEGCFALPQDCREARQIGINGIPMRQRSEFYIGKVATGSIEGCCAPYECRDLGDFYIPQYLPKRRGIRIALVATDDGDAGKQVTIEVTNEYGQPVKETLTLLANQQPAIMQSVAYDVTFFKKPRTFGNVSLQLHYDDGQRFYFASYLPTTEEGLFRRKQLPQRFWGCNIVRILGKTRYVPIRSEDDILPINDILALGDLVAAVSAWRRRDKAEYSELMLSALEEAKAQMRDADSASNVKQINVRTYSGNPSLAGNVKRWA
jgi:hypothetical protein